MTQEDRQCTINVTLNRFAKPLHISGVCVCVCMCVCVCVCVLLIYTACKAHAPYYRYIVVSAVSGPTVFFHIIS
jgi:hypothetical protein